MKVVNGVPKYTETEVAEIIHENGLDWDSRSELFRQCSECGAYTEVEYCAGERVVNGQTYYDTCDDCIERDKTGEKHQYWWNKDPYDPTEENVQYVTVYEVTRHYGGPEEGGWWYNALTLIESVPVDDIAEAKRVKAELEEQYEDHKWGDIYSARGGVDIDILFEETSGENETTERPCYC